MSASPASPATSLDPLLPILNAFNHRHHNQHRLAHWWPVFRILRRTVRALIDDLARPSSLSSRREPTSSPPPPRATWLHKHFVPRAYVYALLTLCFYTSSELILNRAFTQLAADNQHAPLGLLLLAVLARIHAVLSQLLVDDTPSSIPTTKAVSSNNNKNDAVSQDKGVAVARNQLPPAKNTPPSRVEDAAAQPSSSQQGSKVDRESTKPIKTKSKDTKEKKKKKGKGDALSSLFGSLA